MSQVSQHGPPTRWHALPIGFTLEGAPMFSFPDMAAYVEVLKAVEPREEGRRLLARWQSLTNVRRVLAVGLARATQPTG